MAQRDRLKSYEKQQLALKLALAGYDYQTIADRAGYNSRQAAWKAVKSALDKSIKPVSEDIRQLQIERLDAMLRSIWLSVQNGNLKAIDRAIKLEERRAKLLGTDAPVKTETVETFSEGTPTLTSLPADVIAPDFLNVYRDIRDGAHTEYVFYGGRGSTKSSFVSLVAIWLLVNNPTYHMLACRQVAATLRDSVYSQLVWAINTLGLSDKFACSVSPLEIRYLPTGQTIYFRGADDPNKLKSIKPKFGSIAILWLEELDQFAGQEAVRKIEQSAIRGGDRAYIFKSFNPPPTSSNWANKYIRIPKANQYQHRSNYLGVPVEWLGKAFIDEAEHLKEVNPSAYSHEYLGEPSIEGGLVFPNVKLEKITDEQIKEFDRINFGLDWGYALDPVFWGKLYYDATREIIYVFDEFRALKMGNRELADVLLYQKGMTREDLLIADSAEPKSIADMREYGLNCRAAEKGADSVRYSIRWLQNRAKIVIDPERCPYTAQEFLEYEYVTTRDGEFVSEYPDRNNHSIDMVRYALNLIWRRRGS